MPVSYRFGDTLYKSPEAALKAQRERNHDVAALIRHTPNPLGGRALCIIPSKNVIERKAIRKSLAVKPEAINYLVSSVELEFDGLAEALQRRKIFDELKIVKSEDPESIMLTGYEFIIYCVIKGPDQPQWFLKILTVNYPLPIYYDMSLPYGAPRMLSWLNNIEKLARENLKR